MIDWRIGDLYGYWIAGRISLLGFWFHLDGGQVASLPSLWKHGATMLMVCGLLIPLPVGGGMGPDPNSLVPNHQGGECEVKPQELTAITALLHASDAQYSH